MDIDKRLQQIDGMMAQGWFSPAAREICNLIEFALREFIQRHRGRLSEQAQLKVQKIEMKKGGGNKGVQSFTLGELVGLLQESKFFSAWSEATGNSCRAMSMVQLNEVNKVRNSLTHDGESIQREDAEFLRNVLTMFLQAFGIMSLEDARFSTGLPVSPGTESALPAGDMDAAAAEYEVCVLDAIQDDNIISPVERRFLDAEARRLGLDKDQTSAIETKIRATTSQTEPQPIVHEKPVEVARPQSDVAWPDNGRAWLRRLRDQIQDKLAFEIHDQIADEDIDDIDNESGSLWFGATPKHSVEVWFAAKRLDKVTVLIGFYSENESRDPMYREARRRIEREGDLTVGPGWTLGRAEWKALALEGHRRIHMREFDGDQLLEQASEAMIRTSQLVAPHLEGAHRAGD